MKNLRVVYDNAVDRATVTASYQPVLLGVANLKSDNKFEVYRTNTTSATITTAWTALEPIRAIALPFCNLSPTATIRAQVYALNGSTLIHDSGVVLASPFPLNKLRGWTAAASASAYAQGGGNCARLWLPLLSAGKVVLTIVDTANLQGYLEFGRLIIGDYWEPMYGVETGATVTMVDSSKHTRTDAGNLVTDTGIRYRKQTIPLPWLEATDRAALWSILSGNGVSAPIFISMYPNHTDAKLEATHQMYGKLTTSPIMTTPYFNVSTATIDIEEI